ncbi:M60 family metallopeptidase [Bacteroidales bacterium OttesenSCG-928-M06]|nr:M60 family metallopeptidase [Bacteroidales bacterium OttesenSCG-928-M06]
MKNIYLLFSLIVLVGISSQLKAQEMFLTSIAPMSELIESIPEDLKTKPMGGYTNIFADNLMTSLKPGVTVADIEGMKNSYFRELANTLYRGGYSLDFRKGEFFPYMTRNQMQEKYLVSAYNLYENATGIYFPIGKHVVIVDGLPEGKTVNLAIPHYEGGSSASGDWGLKSKSYQLKNGVNVVNITGWAGIGYISYFTSDWETAKSIKMHFPYAVVQGYFDITKHKNKDFVKLLENANAYSFFDVIGERIHLTYTVEAYRNYTKGKAEELVARYDTIMAWEQRSLGWDKYLEIPKNRVHCRANQSYFMYKDNTGASFEHSTMSYIANPDRLYNDFWGAVHEIGHIHQYKFNNWTGLGEVSVNYPNLMFEHNVIKPTSYRVDVAKGYNAIVKKNISSVTVPFLDYTAEKYNGGVDANFGRLCAFAQLYYYFDEIGKDFFPDINEALRNTTESTSGWGPAQYELHYIRTACDVTKLNLIPFFEKWGMLYYTDQDGRASFTVGDYSNATYKLEKSKVDALKDEIKTKGYPAPAVDITLVKANGGRITP